MIEEIDNKLLKIIEGGESITTEFKEAVDKLPKSLFETVCSFLNRNRWRYFFRS